MTGELKYTKAYKFILPEGVTLTSLQAEDDAVVKPLTYTSDQDTEGPFPPGFIVSCNQDSVIACLEISQSVAGNNVTETCHIELNLTGQQAWKRVVDFGKYPNDNPAIIADKSDSHDIQVNIPYMRSYLLAPGVQVKNVTVTNQAEGFFRLNNSEVNSVEATGGTVKVAPTAVSFDVYGNDAYSTAYISMEYYPTATSKTTEKAHCTITFKLTGDKQWEQQGSTILAPSSTNNVLPIVPPTGNTGAGPETLNKSMVYLLDAPSSGNLLFRGNSPLSGHDKPINFATLHTYMKQQYDFQAQGVVNPKAFPEMGEYVLCEIALLSPGSETYEIAYSVASYGSSKTQTALQDKISNGKADDVVSLASGTTPYPASPIQTPTDAGSNTVYGEMFLWQVEPGDDSYDLKHAKHLYEMVNTSSTFTVDDKILPVIYYVHCCNGHDRTGIVSSIYMILKSDKASHATNSATDLTEQYIRGTTLNILPAEFNGPQLYTHCVYYSGSNKGLKAPNQSRCFLIHAQSNPNFLYRKTVESAYNTIKGNSGTSVKAIDSDAEQGTSPVYVMDDSSVVPSNKS